MSRPPHARARAHTRAPSTHPHACTAAEKGAPRKGLSGLVCTCSFAACAAAAPRSARSAASRARTRRGPRRTSPPARTPSGSPCRARSVRARARARLAVRRSRRRSHRAGAQPERSDGGMVRCTRPEGRGRAAAPWLAAEAAGRSQGHCFECTSGGCRTVQVLCTLSARACIDRHRTCGQAATLAGFTMWLRRVCVRGGSCAKPRPEPQ